MQRRMRALVFWVISSGPALCAPSSCYCGEEETQPSFETNQIKESIQSVWDGQRSEIVTAMIKFRLIHAVGRHVQPLSRDRVNSIVDQLADSGDPNALRLAVGELVKSESPLKDPWFEILLTVEGDRARREWKYRDKVQERQVSADGVDVIHDVSNRQVNLHPPRGNARFQPTIKTIRVIPSSVPDGALVSIVGDDRIAIDVGAQHLLIERSTGLLLQSLVKSDTGAVLQEVRQLSPIASPDGILLPRIVVRTGYRENQLFSLMLTFLDDVAINEELHPDTFKVQVAAGTTVVDFRSGRDDPRVIRESEPSTDIVRRTDSESSRSSNGFQYQKMLVGFSILISICVVLWFFLRASRRRQVLGG